MTEPITTPDDLAALLGSEVDEGRATTLLRFAQGLCESIVSPLPASAAGVVAGVALRAYVNPQNLTAEGVAGYSATFGVASGGLYLTKQDRATLKRLAGRGGAFSIDLTPADAGQGLAPWDQNVTWLTGVPLADDRTAP